MSLDVAKLEKVRELAGGLVQARCPACAEAVMTAPANICGFIRWPVRLLRPSEGRRTSETDLGAGRAQAAPVSGGSVSLRLKTPPALPPAQSVKTVLAARTLRTLKTELDNGVPAVPATPIIESRTARTAEVKLRAHAREDSTTTL